MRRKPRSRLPWPVGRDAESANAPDAFYSECELVALYVETDPRATVPALDRKGARNRRLRERQDAALARTEARLVVDQSKFITSESSLMKASGRQVDDFIDGAIKIMSSIRICPQ